MAKYFLIIFAFILNGHLEPFKEPKHNVLEMFNEAMMMVVLYHFLLFTPMVYDPETKFVIGYSVILTTCTHIYVNLHLMCRDAYRTLKISYMIHKSRKAFEETR